MAESRLGTLKELLRPRIVKYGGGAILALGAYDAASAQLGLLTIRDMWGVSGALMPLWGWLLVLLGIFVYALFEYARNTRQLVLDAPTIRVSPESRDVPLSIEPPPPNPDITLHEVSRRVIAARGGRPVFPPPDYWEQLSLAITDGVKLNKLTTWARWGKRAIEHISDSELRYGFIDCQAETLAAYNGHTDVTYNDLQFVRAEIDEIWPDVPEEEDETDGTEVPF